MSHIRLTAAQALVRFLAAQWTEIDGARLPLFAGVWAIFGHGNVAGLGEALYGLQDRLPTFRAHNEQGMAHAAIAYAKAQNRRRMMACTTSIGPGALNMVTAAALAHVNRLPVLFLPGDVFASRRPDPVLQQVEDFGDATVSANDCFRPVSRFYDRLQRPEQLLAALPRALQVLTDPADCGPVTLAFCQDVQAEAFDYPESFFAERLWVPRRARADRGELRAATDLLKQAKTPLIIAGGGVHYSGATADLKAFAEAHLIPVAETQAGKSALPYDHPLNLGAIGVTGTSAANGAAERADVILSVGTRLQDFTTGSWALFKQPGRKIIGLNTQVFDAGKHFAQPLVADAREGLAELTTALAGYAAPDAWTRPLAEAKTAWAAEAEAVTRDPKANSLPTDAQVIGAVQRTGTPQDIVVCAAGGLPGELHKLWNAAEPGGYHLEYGFSCMGYEIAGGLGVKLARPDREVIVMVGDGSYLMMNSELATAVMLGLKLTLVVLDNRGFGCINRLQKGTGGAPFNNLLQDTRHETLPEIDFRAHAESLGAKAVKVASLAELEDALRAARQDHRTNVIVIDTDPQISTQAGGHWWDVAVPEVSPRAEVQAAHRTYAEKLGTQTLGA
ncbi:3D-(3,5/4)-trihydroxycyclohexane-1,2-dione acylhydrolase (decyclizing) [Elstera cyanobacteriorum]|uniref:3D-(3,5/4)-trihydroxycyclohexane-1,2-dione acylhydrolase (decyclizing) n=1 Tax=Elstera cyanobacteriorum TaxID=2022747 RepID=UPI0023554FF3|nr:3D-(3,5/4)-trihydroxycyclohexane-1,2-dione acylhydrolase (decyclizing) [Elstera cyanobacteriorum]MCK6444160.1 3D-(3,5/4)-trihydroxycyclohexane-1,2-dione acylhydrolase (decyclizing) [Elstera cyanobacteriorum]